MTALKFYRCPGNAAAETAVKFEGHTIIQIINLQLWDLAMYYDKTAKYNI